MGYGVWGMGYEHGLDQNSFQPNCLLILIVCILLEYLVHHYIIVKEE